MAKDYRDYEIDGQKPKREVEAAERRWWELTTGSAQAGAVESQIKLLKGHQAGRLSQHRTSARLYGNLPVGAAGGVGLTPGQMQASLSALRDSISFNVIASVGETAQARMAKNKPKPFHLTNGGTWKQQRTAKKLNKLIEGIFYECRAYDEGPRRFIESFVFGDGIQHVFERDGRVCWEGVLSSELWVDELEAFYGHPRSLYREKNVDKLVLAAAFPDMRTQIMAADSSNKDKRDDHSATADMVAVRQAWHLPSGEKAEDGKTFISIDGHALTEMEPWKHDFFPFAVLQYAPRLWGFWGQGGAERLQNIQMEINKLLRVMQRTLHLGGTTKIWLKMGSNIPTEHITNQIATVGEYVDQPPVYVSPPLIQKEYFDMLDGHIQRAYRQEGVSEMDASSTKPSGLNSGKALREFVDIGSDRFTTLGQRYQNFFLQLDRLSLATAKDIAERTKKPYIVRVPGKKSVVEISVTAEELAEDGFASQCFPISSLPSDPEGRLQTVQEYAQAGYVTPRQAKKLLDFPDLEQLDSLQNAAEEYLTMVLDKIVDDGDDETPPAEEDDLQLALELVTEYIQVGKLHGLEEKNLEMLRVWKNGVTQLMQAAMPPATMPAQGGAPLAQPTPTPTSDLLPNAPGAAPTLQ